MHTFLLWPTYDLGEYVALYEEIKGGGTQDGLARFPCIGPLSL